VASDAARKRWLDKNPTYLRDYYHKNSEKIRARTRKWRADNKERTRENDLRKHLCRKYNITLETYLEMFAKQGGVCAICLRPEWEKTPAGKVRALCVDHDHETERKRGLLCTRCNRLIGQADEDPVVLQRMIEYLAN